LDANLLHKKIKINIFSFKNENFEYDLILGLDSIHKFKLTHNENLNIQIQKPDNFKISSKNIFEDKQTENMEINIEEKEYAVNFNEDIDTNKFNMDTEHLNTDKRKQINILLDSYTGKTNWSKIAEEYRNRYNETNHSVTRFAIW